MNLNYQEIMDLPEPQNGADVGTMESICSVYAHLVAKFTRLLEEARQIKVCWMQEERMALYAKRLAANQREYRCIERQRRAGEITNFCLRVREWVLSCPKRRLRLRALIGEARIARWQDRRIAYKNRGNVPSTPTKQSKASGSKATRRYEVRNWYRLPSVSQDSNARGLKPYRIDMRHLNMNHLNMDHIRSHISKVPKPLPKAIPLTPAARGMCRAIPAVVFWPDELAADYVHEQDEYQAMPEKPVGERKGRTLTEEEHREKVRTSPWPPSYTEPTTVKEWPD